MEIRSLSDALHQIAITGFESKILKVTFQGLDQGYDGHNQAKIIEHFMSVEQRMDLKVLEGEQLSSWTNQPSLYKCK